MINYMVKEIQSHRVSSFKKKKIIPCPIQYSIRIYIECESFRFLLRLLFLLRFNLGNFSLTVSSFLEVSLESTR